MLDAKNLNPALCYGNGMLTINVLIQSIKDKSRHGRAFLLSCSFLSSPSLQLPQRPQFKKKKKATVHISTYSVGNPDACEVNVSVAGMGFRVK